MLAATDPTLLQGGVVAATFGFAGGLVKYFSGALATERARGDRLESALIDKAAAAMQNMAQAQTGLTEAVKDLSREVRAK